jgi:hypothetical protein
MSNSIRHHLQRLKRAKQKRKHGQGATINYHHFFTDMRTQVQLRRRGRKFLGFLNLAPK